jgi:hypothetical protein
MNRTDDKKIQAQIEFERNKVLYNRTIYSCTLSREWREALCKAQNKSDILGLLHSGFDESMRYSSEYTYEDVVCLYLDYAYGYDNYSSFTTFSPNGNRDSDQQHAKEEIAKKAFSMLCLKIFKDTTENSGHKNTDLYREPSWWSTILPEKILTKIVSFFSFHRNIPHTDVVYPEINARDFLYKLSTSAWKAPFLSGGKWPKSVPKILIKNRKHFMKFLCNMGEARFFVSNWEFLSKEDFSLLKNLAGCPENVFEENLTSNNPVSEAYALVSQKIELSKTELPSEKTLIS